MSYPPEITEKDRKVLEVIARGHPERTMTSTRNGISKQVSALTWNEIQLARNASFSDISDCIAHLVANGYIDSGRQNPSIWGRLKGESETAFFWVTPAGQAFLRTDSTSSSTAVESRDQKLKSTPADLDRVQDALIKLGYNISHYGVGVALLSLESGYSHCETASHLALATLARDAKDAGFDITKLIALVPHARAMIDVLTEYKNAGLMRDELFKNDARAILGVVIVEKGQPEWISRVLSDPVIAKERVATSRIN